MRNTDKPKWIHIAQIISWIVGILITVLCWNEFRNLTVKDIVESTPKDLLLSIGLILVYYILKSFIVIVPVLVVQIAAGIIFPIPIAIAVNLLGLVLTLSISFVMGHYTGKNYVDKLIHKYPKSAVIQSFSRKNEFFFCFMIHSLCIFPMNMIGMFAGSLNISYKNYFWGAFAGSLIRVISVTVMGASATKPTSPTFILALFTTLVVSLASYLAYKAKIRKSSDTKTAPDDYHG